MIAAPGIVLLSTIVAVADECPPLAKGASGNKHVAGEWPLLKAMLITPKANPEQFRLSTLRANFPRDQRPRTRKNTVFKNKEDAAAAALKWVRATFGEFPVYSSLIVDDVNCLPVSGWQAKDGPCPLHHVVVLRQHWKGIPTDRHAVIYLEDTEPFSASVGFCELTPIPSSCRRLVSHATAVRAWEQVPDSTIERTIGSRPAKLHFHLSYVWSPKEYVARREDILAPMWVYDEDERLMVDGYDGTVRFND